jgi:uncharacterized membrane protein HdeD (DUF308 family)
LRDAGYIRHNTGTLGLGGTKMQTYMSRLRGDPADMLGRLGRHWGWAIFFGIVTLSLGVLALAWPDRTLIVVAVVFGVQLVVMGIWRFVAAFATSDLGGGTRVLYALLGVLSLVIGLYALRHVLITIVALALLLGIFWVVNGTTELFTALSGRGMPNRGWISFSGILSIIAGIILLAYPGISVLVLAVVIAIWLIIYGVMLIAMGFQMRTLTRRV